ncbi:hypothetical protein IU510_08090 [Nocardia cyriacigeorgica]|uniref:hypothetical protein n=1 Tax=Nocardia cyriacigeorgica TaxID=135487 RepID=UPI00189606E2|nr:hypothetical protein [Nocardia cyriacigeorgica]MBF6098037.1 hypothetical protein [Nocardia cyriacigeorgica]MBF6517931.1 hypothetical protein [Nocardia cyriacigeorgica]
MSDPQFPELSQVPPPQFEAAYDRWTRRPVVYLPVVRRGELIGYLWAGTGIRSRAAGYMRRVSVDPDNVTCPEFWGERLDENHRDKLIPEQAIRHWIGYPEDFRCGGVPAEARVQQANSTKALWDQLNPDGRPMGEGPLIQDAEWIPDSRAPSGYQLWSTPHCVTPALRRCRDYPHDRLSGAIPADARELVAPALDDLKALAADQPSRQESASNPGHQFTALSSPPAPIPKINDYSRWTRKPVVYLPVVSDTRLIGYLWAGVGSHAAGYMRRISADPDNITCPDFWNRRLTANYQNQLTPEEAIQSWIGVPEDPRCGGVPADATTLEAPSEQALWDLLNPDGPPMGEAPFILDEDMVPDCRAPGGYRLLDRPYSVSPPTYAGETSTRVHFLQVAKAAEIVAVLWASPTENAAGYLPFRWAGKAGIVGRGLWEIRLSDSYAAGRDPLEAIRDCRRHPEDEYSGRIEPNTPEGIAPSLGELRRFTDEYSPPQRETVQAAPQLRGMGRFWARLRRGGARSG